MIKGGLVLVSTTLRDYVGFLDTIEDNVLTLKKARTVGYINKLFTQYGVTNNMEPTFGSLIEKLILFCGKGEEVIRFTNKAAKSILDTYYWDNDIDYDLDIENKVLIMTEDGKVYEGFVMPSITDDIILLRGRNVYVIFCELIGLAQALIDNPYKYEKGPSRKNNIVIEDIKELVYYRDYIMNVDNKD